MSTLGWIILIAYIALMIPFAALFKVTEERCYFPNDWHILSGLFWPIALAFYIVGQLLLVVGTGLGNFYEWAYKWFDKHL